MWRKLLAERLVHAPSLQLHRRQLFAVNRVRCQADPLPTRSSLLTYRLLLLLLLMTIKLARELHHAASSDANQRR